VQPQSHTPEPSGACPRGMTSPVPFAAALPAAQPAVAQALPVEQPVVAQALPAVPAAQPALQEAAPAEAAPAAAPEAAPAAAPEAAPAAAPEAAPAAAPEAAAPMGEISPAAAVASVEGAFANAGAVLTFAQQSFSPGRLFGGPAAIFVGVE
jgi:hypothetical protein